MSKQETQEYLLILLFCFIILYGLSVMTQFIDKLAANSIQDQRTTQIQPTGPLSKKEPKKEPINHSRGIKTDSLKKEGK